MNEATWNVLHDGSIDAIEGELPGELKLSVGIAYLCAYLPTQSEHVVVTLAGCEQFEYRPYEDPPVKDLAAIAALSLEIHSADPMGKNLNITCRDDSYGGALVVRYDEARISTAEGQPLMQSEVEEAAERYWSNWKRKNDAGTAE